MASPRRGLWLALLMVFLGPVLAHAQTAKVAWDASADAAGYVLRWGVTKGVYPSEKNVGSVTNAEITGLTPGTPYWVVVEAYDAQGQASDPSTPLEFIAELLPAPPPSPTTPVHDMNQDGSPDIVWQNIADGYVAAWPMRGGSMIDSVLTNPAGVPDTRWRIVGSGNFNTDTVPDLVWQNTNDGSLAVWMMNGTSLLESVSMSPGKVGDTNWGISAVTDVDGDGKSDLVWQERTQGWIAVWLMNGVTLKQSIGLSPERVPDTDWKIVGAGDINADGKQDFIWQHASQGWLAAWLMNGTSLIDSVLLSPQRVADPNWKIVGIADANGDGKQDLYWRDNKNGWLALWVMDGTRLATSLALQPERVKDPNWRIVAVR